MSLTNEEINYRGRFMSIFIDAEYAIGDIVSTLLVGNNALKVNILEFITPGIMLDKKINLFSELLKKKIPHLYERNKAGFDTVRKLIPLRNNFAHKRIEVEIDKRLLHFMSIDNSKIRKQTFRFDDLGEKYELLKNIVIGLRLLHNEIISLNLGSPY